jgi:predicted dehydrogenase/NADPH:quinone reductase-like Zn-dependent oxidoreductase
MKQILQSYRTGTVRLAEVPAPRCGPSEVLVETRASLVSLGTERSVVELGRKSLLAKAKARPDLVRRVIEKAKTEGIATTISQVTNRLDQPVPLGYSAAGVVRATGRNANRFAVGDRVACIGQGFASHAEVLAVPEMLCTLIPANVPFESAAFGMVGSIALHGVRCANLSFGDSVVVTGLGLIGLLTAQMLTSYGCRVVAADIDPHKLDLARKLGIANVCTVEDLPAVAKHVSGGDGVDAVLLTLASSSADPVHQAVDLVRLRGRIVVVGVADVHPHRNELWKKEAEIIVSRAAGAGSLDERYELEGIDLPRSYVRWTEGRNLEEFTRLLSVGGVRTNDLISHRIPLRDAESTYGDILSGKGGPYVGVIFEYEERPAPTAAPRAGGSRAVPKGDNPRVGVLGAGMFGQAVIIPALAETKAVLHTVSSSDGATAEQVSQKFGFTRHVAEHDGVLANPEIDAVLILTRHRSHARLVRAALAAGKHVFVEKPLCVTHEELAAIREELERSTVGLTVGYNRRFSSLAAEMKRHFQARVGPMVVSYRVNAGFVPPTHWVHSPEEGGSRVIGEMCHFVDFMQFLTGAQPTRVFAERVGGDNASVVNNDNVVVTIRFSDGSVGSLTYSGGGDRALGRERVEAFADGMTATLDDFRALQLFRAGKKTGRKLFNQDLGHARELEEFVAAVKRGDGITIPLEDLVLSTAAVFEIQESLQSGEPRSVGL